MARLRTNSAFQRLTAAYASNEMGVTIAYILIPLVILDLTGSATNAGLVTALATTASTVAGIMSGAIADRSNPSFLLRLSFGLEFLLWGLLGLLLWQGTANVAIIAVLAIITSAVGAIDGPSEFVILKRIIPTNQLGEATAITEARGSTTGLIGTPIGGALFTLGGHIAFGIQSLLHLIAIFLVPPVRDARTTDPEDQPEKPHFLQDVKTGFTLVMGNMGLRHLTYVASIANLGMVPVSFILLAELETHGTPPPLIGVIPQCCRGCRAASYPSPTDRRDTGLLRRRRAARRTPHRKTHQPVPARNTPPGSPGHIRPHQPGTTGHHPPLLGQRHHRPHLRGCIARDELRYHLVHARRQ